MGLAKRMVAEGAFGEDPRRRLLTPCCPCCPWAAVLWPPCDGIESTAAAMAESVAKEAKAKDLLVPQTGGRTDGWMDGQRAMEQPSLYDQSVGEKAINGHRQREGRREGCRRRKEEEG